jgi:hypothetical protein
MSKYIAIAVSLKTGLSSPVLFEENENKKLALWRGAVKLSQDRCFLWDWNWISLCFKELTLGPQQLPSTH